MARTNPRRPNGPRLSDDAFRKMLGISDQVAETRVRVKTFDVRVSTISFKGDLARAMAPYETMMFVEGKPFGKWKLLADGVDYYQRRSDTRGEAVRKHKALVKMLRAVRYARIPSKIHKGGKP